MLEIKNVDQFFKSFVSPIKKSFEEPFNKCSNFKTLSKKLKFKNFKPINTKNKNQSIFFT